MKCVYCNRELIKKSQKKFCNRSCAASFNNHIFPKRQPEHECLNCKVKIGSGKRYCDESCRRSAFAARESQSSPNKIHVSNRRRKVKEILVQEAGGKCLDCGYIGPPFVFDFDHRNPDEKEIKIGSGNTYAIDKLRVEIIKCDLVCANCHRMRTHIQRCHGCEYCV